MPASTSGAAVGGVVAFGGGGSHRTLMGTDVEPQIRDEAVNEIREQRVSAEKALRLLGWRPTRSLNEGLRRTIDWYRTHLQHALQ